MSRPTVFTVNGHPLPEVVSALQKAIRRGRVDDALYWAVDMDLSGYAAYCWRRLLYIASEDVGLAAPTVASEVRALFDDWRDYVKGKPPRDGRLFLVHAVLRLVTAPKSRLVDWALLTHYSDHAALKREIPDYALDKHTARGKRMGRGTDHFVDVGADLNREGHLGPVLESFEEEYREHARQLGHAGKEPLETHGGKGEQGTLEME